MNEVYGWHVFTSEKMFYIDTVNLYFKMQKVAGALSKFQMIGFIILFFLLSSIFAPSHNGGV